MDQGVIAVMLRFHTSGYLFGRKFRNECIVIGSISLSILLSFILLLWYDLLDDHSRTQAKCVAVTVITVGIAYLLLSAFKTFQRMSAKYECNGSIISNTYLHQQFTINMEDGYFLSKVSFKFFLGKGSTTKVFFLFSKEPVCIRPEDIYGVNAIEAILRNCAVVLPYDSQTIQWCMETVRIAEVPSYPNVAYMPAKSTKQF